MRIVSASRIDRPADDLARTGLGRGIGRPAIRDASVPEALAAVR
ncbi:hypothetical protein [Methylobacterium symbioticum]|jgi:hypothetical protein|nr:hypothetical protein [Methylobacterium symbioticum]